MSLYWLGGVGRRVVVVDRGARDDRAGRQLGPSTTRQSVAPLLAQPGPLLVGRAKGRICETDGCRPACRRVARAWSRISCGCLALGDHDVTPRHFVLEREINARLRDDRNKRGGCRVDAASDRVARGDCEGVAGFGVPHESARSGRRKVDGLVCAELRAGARQQVRRRRPGHGLAGGHGNRAQVREVHVAVSTRLRQPDDPVPVRVPGRKTGQLIDLRRLEPHLEIREGEARRVVELEIEVPRLRLEAGIRKRREVRRERLPGGVDADGARCARRSRPW